LTEDFAMIQRRLWAILLAFAGLGLGPGCSGRPICEELRREHLLGDLRFLGELLRRRAATASEDPAKLSEIHEAQLQLLEVEFAALLLGLDPERGAETNARLESIIRAIQESPSPEG
jgi:hypothetical protein